MAIEITVPKLGWSMDEGTFVEWLKKDGDEVKSGDLLFALESDKAVQEIESLDSGILRIPENGPKKDEVVKVGQVLGYLTAPGEDFQMKSAVKSMSGNINFGRAGQPVPPACNACGVDTAGRPLNSVGQGCPTLPKQKTVSHSDEVLPVAPAVSPRAARRAMEQGVDLRAVKGTGKNGRIVEKDIFIFANAGNITPPAPHVSNAPKSTPAAAMPTLRRTIAERMLKSRSATAPVTLVAYADASALVGLRNQLKTESGPAPTYNDMLIKIAATALLKHPVMNSSWEVDRIVSNETVNIGMAVDTEAGLMVPVVHNAPALSLRELAARTRDLGERARQRKLSSGELTGGTFTVSNLGTTGVDIFTPIINYPECAVLGIGRITLQPAVNESGAIVPRHMVWLSLTFDHRITDGAPAARFLDTVKYFIETINKELIQ